MARDQSPLVNWSQYLAARMVAMGLGSCDAPLNLRLAGQVGRLLFRVCGKHRHRAIEAVRASFPHLPEAQVQQLAQGSFEHLARLAVEVLHTPRVLTRETWPQHASFQGLGPGIRAMDARRPCILVTGHLGNWEVLGFLLAVLGYDLDVLARPIDNPLINRWLLGVREMRGMRVIVKQDATDRMLEVMAGGGSLAFIADQNAGAKGLFVPFFGRLASTHKSIGLLALQYNCPVLCGYAHRVGPGFRFEVGLADVIEPEDWAQQPDPLYYLTARYTRAIETMVRMRPEQYFWMHRRWKTRPRHELQGRPMPAGLQRNLEALPWMDTAQISQLAAVGRENGAEARMLS